MKHRRLELDIKLVAAPVAAGVSKSTWVNWEKDRNVPEEFNFKRIERVLRWEAGSVRAILDGGTPVHLPPGTVTALPAPGHSELPPDDDFVRELRAMENISPTYLEVVIRAYWEDRAREQRLIQEKYRNLARAAGN
jgi:hypothetical protein